jgi:hypothetical protein
MKVSWDALAAGESGLTAALAGLSAMHFFRRHARGGPGNRQTAALALGMSAAGAALAAAYNVSAMLGGEPTARVSLIAGLPAFAGQALMALLVARQRRTP